ncbi:MAG: hypothetical protein CBD36_000475, partial [Candidatus Puniceispirillum sp. TMED176]
PTSLILSAAMLLSHLGEGWAAAAIEAAVRAALASPDTRTADVGGRGWWRAGWGPRAPPPAVQRPAPAAPSPRCDSSMAADRISEVGFARSSPAISGAEPCCACAAACRVPAFSDPARPRLPDSSDARSDRMSPNMLVVTTTSNRPGSRTIMAAAASTSISS